MVDRIVIKLGGGLITDKANSKSFDISNMDSVSGVISELQGLGISVVIIHGAGSYGHILAKKWSIAEGLDREIYSEQKNAVSQIRKDMRELNSLVIESLHRTGLECESLPPSNWAIGTGNDFKGDLDVFERFPSHPIPVTFGDVVDTEDGAEFGILSGDDLMLRISRELSCVTHSIFLMGDSAGVMDKPPSEKGATLLTTCSPSNMFQSAHYSDIDVTGGIALKVDRAFQISKDVNEVWIMDGRKPSRILELVRTGKTIGTKILPS